MSQSQRKLQPLHEEAIWKWRSIPPGRKKAPKSLRECVELLAAGSANWPPVNVTQETVRATFAKLADEREALYSPHNSAKPNTDRLDIMVTKLLAVAERETARCERAERAGKLDANRLLKLARAVRSLFDLQERAERGGDRPEGDGDDQEPEQPTAPSFAQSLAAAVPDDPPDQDTTKGGEPPTPKGDGPAERTEVELRPEAKAGTHEAGDVAGSDGVDEARTHFATSGLSAPPGPAPATL